MTPLVMPRWQGQGWPVKRTPMTSTKVARHVSGSEVRTAMWVRPLYQFEINFEGLSSNARHPGLAEGSLEELQGFYLACGGALTPFLYIDPTENTARGQVLGIGDGSRTIFPFQRSIGSMFTEPVSWVTNVAAVYVGGQVFGNVTTPVIDYGLASQPVTTAIDFGLASDPATIFLDYEAVVGSLSGWTLAQPASLVFATAPAAGAIILADFSYAFLCRFSDDTVELDHFMDGLWSNDSLKFQTFR